MNTQTLVHILREASLYVGLDLDPGELSNVEINQRSYQVEEFSEFKRDLIEAGRKINLLVLEQAVDPYNLTSFIREAGDCVALFRFSNTDITTSLVVHEKGKLKILFSTDTNELDWHNHSADSIAVMVLMPYKGVVSEFQRDSNELIPISPVKRFFRLLGTERRDIGYILIYALVIGLVGLVLPLGLQNIIELISGGVFTSSVYVLIGLVTFGLLFIGVLQIVQISMVEHMQRRIFAKAAFEFAFRIPRLKLEALTKNYAPELINRFFDVTTIQKGIPKILLDLSAAGIQIIFSLLLLSLYHPFFVFFSLLLVGVLVIIFYLTGPKGLDSSLNESKYKYKVVQWLEELARAINSFKLAGNTDLPHRRTDYATSNYIKYRKKHFSVILTQFSFVLLFKVAIVGGLLVVGALLVVDREITLGQFVASEVIIILVLNAVEKILLYLDVVYDLFTAVDKVSHVTDLPIERSGGFDLPSKKDKSGHQITIQNLHYQYADAPKAALQDVNLTVNAGERICIAGPGGSGKSTLTNIIAGFYSNYTGSVAYDNMSLRDLDVTNLRDRVAKNISPEDIFDGTLYENITIGKSTTSLEQVLDAVDKAGLLSYVNSLPEGMHTHILSGGKGLPSSIINRLILARCLAKNPEVILLNDFFAGMSKTDKLDLMRCVIHPQSKWTLIVVSNDPLVMASCDRVVILEKGEIVADGAYNVLLKEGIISNYFE